MGGGLPLSLPPMGERRNTSEDVRLRRSFVGVVGDDGTGG